MCAGFFVVDLSPSLWDYQHWHRRRISNIYTAVECLYALPIVMMTAMMMMMVCWYWFLVFGLRRRAQKRRNNLEIGMKNGRRRETSTVARVDWDAHAHITRVCTRNQKNNLLVILLFVSFLGFYLITLQEYILFLISWPRCQLPFTVSHIVRCVHVEPYSHPCTDRYAGTRIIIYFILLKLALLEWPVDARGREREWVDIMHDNSTRVPDECSLHALH